MDVTHLPTFVGADWTVARLRDAVIAALGADNWGTKLSLFFYAVTESGWREIRHSALAWKKLAVDREITAYVGTDHGITEPEALSLMRGDGVKVRLLVNYQGVFHPKVFWLAGVSKNSFWVGSNNLTRDALLNNIEFAVQINCSTTPPEWAEWASRIHDASTEYDSQLADSYAKERVAFAKARAEAKVGTFTWSKKKEPKKVAEPALKKGDLIIEIMPLETGLDGKQIQLPKAAVLRVFGLPDEIGASRVLSIRQKGNAETRPLRMTIFPNNSVRLSINELDYRDRPCVMVFRALTNASFEFEIVQQNIFPSRYATLLKLCTQQTRRDSRRWTII